MRRGGRWGVHTLSRLTRGNDENEPRYRGCQHYFFRIIPGMIVALTASDYFAALHFTGELDVMSSTGRRARDNEDTGSEAHGSLTSGPVVLAYGPRVRNDI